MDAFGASQQPPLSSQASRLSDRERNKLEKHRLQSTTSQTTGLSSLTKIPPSASETRHASLKRHISNVDSDPLHQVSKRIHTAASRDWDHRFQYRRVHALLLYWEDDDLNVAPEVASLASTFREIYHYYTKIWTIKSERPSLDLTSKLIQFLRDNDAEGNLVILYYGGHAVPNPQPGGAPLWRSRRENGTTMFPGAIQSMIEDSVSDFLLLYDCCYAFHPPSPATARPGRRNVIEVISAVGFDGIAAEPGEHSFTNHLDEVLALSFREGQTLTAVDLHMQLMTRLQAWTPSRQRQQTGFTRDDRGPLPQTPRRRCPLHYWLFGAPKSIALRPAKTLSFTETTSHLPHRHSSFRQPQAIMGTSSDLVARGTIQPSYAKPTARLSVSFSVIREELDVEAWAKWLRAAPPEARDLIEVTSLTNHTPFSTTKIRAVCPAHTPASRLPYDVRMPKRPAPISKNAARIPKSVRLAIQSPNDQPIQLEAQANPTRTCSFISRQFPEILQLPTCSRPITMERQSEKFFFSSETLVWNWRYLMLL
ncbi:hypothetical protein B0H63DRAFT_485916 [Podospora didyma]|uniref:Uncharacterized protein n=1 Tax=Podospora didyma TaxID=330526 RepID=A0AAE0N4J8_9PEZI|nr:hypothetical protein B0H63DRAFT_485916 [Podospora didyma]